MSRASIKYDVIVMGGGPAGSTLAMRLVGYGLRVALLDRPYRRRQHLGESLPSSVHGIFDALGLGARLNEVGAARVPTHYVVWGTDRPAMVLQASGERRGGYYVWRDELDRLLLDTARRQGVEVQRGAALSVRRFRPAATVRVRYRGDPGEGTLEARLVADASGRAGVLARRFRKRQRPFRTLAITGYWRVSESESESWVEAFSEGWIWSAPMKDGLRDVTLMVDQDEVLGRREGLYPLSLEQAPLTASRLAQAKLVGSPRGCDATPYSSRRFAGRDFILLGDAASFLDPLCSHGVHKAMDSAMTGAVVVRTILERPERAQDAVEFFEGREARIVAATQERLASLYGQEGRFPQSLFWKKRRAGALRPAPARSRPERPLRRQARLRPAPGVRLIEAPVLQHDFIERQEVLVAPGEPRGVRYRKEVCLPEVFKLGVSARTAGEAAAASAAGEARAFEALDWLRRAGFLEET